MPDAFCLILTKFGKCLVNYWDSSVDPSIRRKTNVRNICNVIVALQQLSGNSSTSITRIQDWVAAIADNSDILVALFTKHNEEGTKTDTLRIKSIQILNIFLRLYELRIPCILTENEVYATDAERIYVYRFGAEEPVDDVTTLPEFEYFEDFVLTHILALPSFEEQWLRKISISKGVLHALIIDPIEKKILLDSKSTSTSDASAYSLPQSQPTLWMILLTCCSLFLQNFMNASTAADIEQQQMNDGTSEERIASEKSVTKAYLFQLMPNLVAYIRIVRMWSAACIVVLMDPFDEAESFKHSGPPISQIVIKLMQDVKVAVQCSCSVFSTDAMPKSLRKEIEHTGKSISRSFPTRISSKQHIEKAIIGTLNTTKRKMVLIQQQQELQRQQRYLSLQHTSPANALTPIKNYTGDDTQPLTAESSIHTSVEQGADYSASVTTEAQSPIGIDTPPRPSTVSTLEASPPRKLDTLPVPQLHGPRPHRRYISSSRSETNPNSSTTSASNDNEQTVMDSVVFTPTKRTPRLPLPTHSLSAISEAGHNLPRPPSVDIPENRFHRRGKARIPTNKQATS